MSEHNTTATEAQTRRERLLQNENFILQQELRTIRAQVSSFIHQMTNAMSVTTEPHIIRLCEDFSEVLDRDYDSDTDEHARVSPTNADADGTFWTRDESTGRLQSE